MFLSTALAAGAVCSLSPLAGRGLGSGGLAAMGGCSPPAPRRCAASPHTAVAGATGTALLVDILRCQGYLEGGDLIVGVENVEVGLQAHQRGVAAKDL